MLCRVSTAQVVSRRQRRVLCSLAARVQRQRQLQCFSCGHRLHPLLRRALAWSSETRWQQRARRAQSVAQRRWVASALACRLAHWRSGVAQMQRILVSAEEWHAEAKLVQSRMELDALQWSSGVQRRAWRGWSALVVWQRSARECIRTFRQHSERRHVERVLGLWCSWSAPRAQRRVATRTFQRRAAVRSSRDARVEAGERCLLRASVALWYAVVAEFQRLRTAAKRMRLRAASVRRRGARATARRSRRFVLHGFGVRAARPAAKRMRLRTASVRRRGRERRHVVVAASSSTVSGCELPGNAFWLRLWETIRHALSFFRYQQPRLQFGALVPHEVPVQYGAPVHHGARFASTCSVLRVLSSFCASSVYAAPAPGVEYTSLVPAASFVAPAPAWTQYRRLGWSTPSHRQLWVLQFRCCSPCCASSCGGVHLSFVCGERSSWSQLRSSSRATLRRVVRQRQRGMNLSDNLCAMSALRVSVL